MDVVLPCFLLFFADLVWNQETLIVRWNNTLLLSDAGYPQALIYLHEIGGGNPDPDRDGVLICRYSMSDLTAGWRKPNGVGIAFNNSNDSFRQFGSYGPPTRVQLARTGNFHGDISNNGLWTCNAGGMRRHVPLYTIGSGTVTINSVSLGTSPSFSSTSPRFTVIADTSGGPPTTFSWKNNGVTVSNVSNSISIKVNPNNDTAGRINCHYRSTLEVTAVTPGNYTYVASNRATFRSVSRTLRIEGGNITNFEATQTGINRVRLTWSAPPGPAADGMYRITGNSTDETASTTSHTVVVSGVGIYNFQVTYTSSHFPAGVAALRFTVKNASAPSGISLSHLSATSLTVSWCQPMFSFNAQNYVVSLMRLTSCSSILPIRGPRILPGTKMQEDFQDLHEFTQYRVNITAVFQSTVTNSSETTVMDFTTLSTAPSEVPRNVATMKTSRTITISWDAIDCSHRNGPNFHYDVDFRQQVGGASALARAVTSTLFRVEGLQPFTNYIFRVRAVNDVGNGAYSDERIIQTSEDIPGRVSGLGMQLTSFTSVMVAWSPPQEPNGIIVMYELTYLLNETISMPESITSNLNYLIESVVNTRIEVRVRAYTFVGPGPIVTASITLPSPIVMNIRVESLTDTSVEASWDKIMDIPGITEYVIYYAPVSLSKKRQNKEQRITVPSTENSVEIDGLESTVEYQYQVTFIAMFGERRLEGHRSPVTDNTRFQIMQSNDSPCESCQDDISVPVSVSVVVTFLLTIILNNALLLVGRYISRGHCNKPFKKISTDTSGVAMKENPTYDPVISCQQPQDYTYTQSDVKTENEYDVIN